MLRRSRAPRTFANSDTGTQNAWAPGIRSGGHTIIYWDGAGTNLTLNGMSSTGITPGTMVTIKAVGTSGIIFWAHQSGSAVAANRLFTMSADATMWSAPRGYATLIYNGVFWYVVGHDPGAGLGTTFNASHYTASTAGTWTVESGDVSIRQAIIDGLQRLQIAVETTTVAQSGGQPTALRASTSVLNGGTYGSDVVVPCIIVDNGTRSMGFCRATSTFLEWKKLDGSQFANSTNLTSVYCNFFTAENG